MLDTDSDAGSTGGTVAEESCDDVGTSSSPEPEVMRIDYVQKTTASDISGSNV